MAVGKCDYRRLSKKVAPVSCIVLLLHWARLRANAGSDRDEISEKRLSLLQKHPAASVVPRLDPEYLLSGSEAFAERVSLLVVNLIEHVADEA